MDIMEKKKRYKVFDNNKYGQSLYLLPCCCLYLISTFNVYINITFYYYYALYYFIFCICIAYFSFSFLRKIHEN